MQANEFAALVLPAARAVQLETRLPVSFLLAQWAHETGWGSNYSSQVDNNYGGLKPWWGESNAGISGYNHYQNLNDWARGYSYFVRSNGNYQDALTYCKDEVEPNPFVVADKMGIWVGRAGAVDQLTGIVISGPIVYANAIKQLITDYNLLEYDMAIVDRAYYAQNIEPLVKETIKVMVTDDPETRSAIANIISTGGSQPASVTADQVLALIAERLTTK